MEPCFNMRGKVCSLFQSQSFFQLLLAIKGTTNLQLPTTFTKDIQDGFYYAFSTLEESEQQLIQYVFFDGMTCREISTLLQTSESCITKEISRVFSKLRSPSRWNYIQYGITGYLKQQATSAYQKGYHTGYSDGYQVGIQDAHYGISPVTPDENALNVPIKALGLSTHACNCLVRAGYQLLGDIANLRADTIRQIRSLGSKSANEIALALQSHGIDHSDWYQFLL